MKFFKDIWQNIKKSFNQLFGKKKETKLIKMEDGSLKPERIATGNSNGLLSMHERNQKNMLANKKQKKRRREKLAKKSRKINYKKAA